ncbi:hypothetical protein A0H81_11294 [Grifola frondosa]|uniref:Uncharacterized protein n=1 Tax=Grifola frondosa TaxID=5627 RepID=A0A1C7LW68_GRIFR|nr:hypothetical protein A0H81_11294 [Grifola frondosa]
MLNPTPRECWVRGERSYRRQAGEMQRPKIRRCAAVRTREALRAAIGIGPLENANRWMRRRAYLGAQRERGLPCVVLRVLGSPADVGRGLPRFAFAETEAGQVGQDSVRSTVGSWISQCETGCPLVPRILASSTRRNGSPQMAHQPGAYPTSWTRQSLRGAFAECGAEPGHPIGGDIAQRVAGRRPIGRARTGRPGLLLLRVLGMGTRRKYLHSCRSDRRAALTMYISQAKHYVQRRI